MTQKLNKGLFLVWSLLLFAFCHLNLNAQNVTVSPTTGNLVAALTGAGETGFADGWSSMWRHEQLPLTFSVSDQGTLTNAGQLAVPAGDLYIYNNYLVISGGEEPNLHCTLSLPKGYRITGYRMVLLNNLNGVGAIDVSANTKWFYETGSDFNTANPLAQAKDANENTTMGPTNSNTEYVIERTSDTMGNTLYFIMTHRYSNGYYGVTIKSFEVFFTAEGTFSADVKPESLGPAVSCVASPFNTSKIDIGDVKARTKIQNGRQYTYYSYDYRNVQDLVAYNYLYQEDAIENGVPSDVAADKKILPLKVDGKDCYGLKNGVYYVETPVEITTSSGNNAPIGYRIVGAHFDYTYGTPTAGGVLPGDTHYYITYTSGGTTYYLNSQARFTTNSSTQWEVDDDNYVHSGDIYLTYSTSSSWTSTTYSLSHGNANSRQKVRLNPNNNRLYITTGSWITTTRYLQGTTSATTTPTFTTGTSNLALWKESTEQIQLPGFEPGEYTLNIYDRTGASIQESITVNSSTEPGVYDMGPCNNDALKFSITGLEEGKQALVSVTLMLQALNPYIDKMDISCTDDNKVLELKQSFTANDFSVSGGKFIFHIPEKYVGEPLTFTFKDLYSKYSDNTYYDGTGKGNGRYSYVTSDYFFPVNGNGNDGLYDNAYDPNASYVNKVYTSTAGNIRFKFNNAEDLSNTSTTQETGYLEEYPFSAATYVGSTDPDGSTNTGAFIPCQLNASVADQKSGTYYVFTADETRWNIAPSTAWQHRYYAYYRMEIELRAKTFEPKLTWKKIYDETLCESNGQLNDDSMWGLELSTVEGDNTSDVGYLTYYEIIEAINNALDENNVDAPATAKQILYVDGSSLYSMLNSTIQDENTQQDVTISLEDLKDIIGTNAIVFLPVNNTSTLDNVAFLTTSGSYRAGKDIILTDKQPFYTPYDIQVDAANYARYNRLISVDKNGKVTKASIIMPFAFNVDSEGKHQNEDDGSTPIAVHTMQTTNCLDTDQETPVIYFPSLQNVTTTEANTPYLIEVLQQSDESTINFVLTQTGAQIKSTSSMAEDYTFAGETASGTADGNNYSFKHHGTFAGRKMAIGGHFFYFSRNRFVCSDELTPSLEYAKLQPFRCYYLASSGNANMVPYFDVILSEGGNSESTGIAENSSLPCMRIQSGKGTLTITSDKTQTLHINNITGFANKTMRMNAGETITVYLPSGIYVVNGVKITVM